MNKSSIEIKNSEIEKNAVNALRTLEGSTVKITQSDDRHIPPSQRGFGQSVAHLDGGVEHKKFSIKKTIENIHPNMPLASNIQYDIISALHKAISIASVVAEKFEENTMGDLKQKQRTSALNDSEKSKFNSLNKTKSVIFIQVLSNYVVRTLSGLEKGALNFEDSIKVSFLNPMEAMNTFLYRLDQGILKNVTNDKDAVSLVLSYAEQVLDIVELQSNNLEGIEFFTSVTYEVKEENFEITGFERAESSAQQELVMDFVKPNEVIGNAIAKHQAMRLAKMMLCYDFEKQKNPFVELGGHIFTFLGDGKPGTGKTTVIKMMCGLMKEYCDIAGYQFYYENFGPDQISSFQGKSGVNAKNFIKNVMNPKVIGFGTIDDIDQVAGKRGDKQSSSGQQEVTAVLMESFAGANTIVRGNCTFGMFSNYPEMIDDALRQRAVARFNIDGPQTEEDYIDIFALLIGKYHNIPLGNANLFETQDIKIAVKEGFSGHNLPKEKPLLDVYNQVVNEVGELNDMEKIGKYIFKISKAIEGDKFSGRSVKNITDSIKVRSMDFDMPDEWFQDASLFLHKSYEEKLEMIKSLREEITLEMVIQEINRFADSEFRYISKSENVEVQKEYDRIMNHKNAMKKIEDEMIQG